MTLRKQFPIPNVKGEIEIKYWVDADDTEQDSEMRQAWTYVLNIAGKFSWKSVCLFFLMSTPPPLLCLCPFVVFHHHLREGKYVRVIGTLKSFREKRNIMAYNIRLVEDFNEVTHHFLEVVHFYCKVKTNDNGPKSGGGMGMQSGDFGGGSNTGLNAPRTALSHQSLGNTPMSNSNDPNAKNSQKVREILPIEVTEENDIYMYIIVCLVFKVRDALRCYFYAFFSLHCKVMQVFRELGSNSDDGADVHDVGRRLPDMTVQQIRACITYLEDEGHLYSTVDEDHYKLTE